MRKVTLAQLCAIVLICTVVSPEIAHAQAIATLSGLTLSQVAPGLVRVEFDFLPITPRYRIDGASTPQITVTFANSTRRPTVVPGASSLGPLKNIDIHDANGLVTAMLTGDGPLRVQAVRADHSLVLFLGSPPPVGMENSANTTVGNDATLIRLRYADVNEIAELLGASAPSDPLAQVSSGTQMGSGFPAGSGSLNAVGTMATTATTQAAAIAYKVSDVISVDRRLNAVVLNGPATTAGALKHLIELIDTPVPSVLLEVSVVELSDTAAHDLGIDFSSGGSLATVSGTVKSQSFPQGQVNLQASVYGAVQKGYGRILARPRILVESGTPASILTGDSIPIFTNISYPGSGSNIVQQQVQYVNVGVSLQILATVDAGDVVHARVQSSVSSVTGYVQGVPQISQRQASTSASVHDGNSLVIGGLVQESELSNTSAFPGLSSIPILGELFKARHMTKQHTDLYIIITPTVTRLIAAPLAPDLVR